VATIVTPTIKTCTELWADPVKFIEQTDHTYETVTEDDVELAIAEATWALWSLSHYRYHGYQCWQEDYALHSGQTRLELAQWPVDEVLSVSGIPDCTSGAGGDALAGWCYIGKGEIALPAGYIPSSACPPSAGHVRVRYRTAPNVPFGTERAVMRLADEYLKAMYGQPGCKLPERITSVTRQGVSWTVLDPLDFMQKGLTGIGTIDHWLSVANGRGPAHMTDPLLRGRVMSSKQLGCGEECEAPLAVVDLGPYIAGELPAPAENLPPDPPPEYDWGMQTARYIGLTGGSLPADATFESPDAVMVQDAGVNQALIVWEDIGPHTVIVKDGANVVLTEEITFDIETPGKLLSVSPDTVDYNAGPTDFTLTGVRLDEFVARVGAAGGQPRAYKNILQPMGSSTTFDVISPTQIVFHGHDPANFAAYDQFEFRMYHQSDELYVDETTTRHYAWLGNPVRVTITGAP
jgi:hypothetical protein